MEKEEVKLRKYCCIYFREMLALGYRRTDFSEIRPGVYKHEIFFLFIEICWGKI